MLISRQNHTGKIFIHIPSPPDIMSLARNCISCEDLFCDIYTPDIILLAGNCISYAGPFFFAAAISISSEGTSYQGPPLVNSHDSTSLVTPLSALPGSSYPKALDAKAAALSLSGGNLSRSVFIIVIKII